MSEAPPVFDPSQPRPGRNDLCYCGSGKKYKKCHLHGDQDAARIFKEALPELLAKQAHAKEIERQLRDEYGVHINFVPPVQWDQGKAWAIGSRLYPHRPRRETFHEFLVWILRGEYGEEWRAKQAALPADRQHFLLKCSNEWDKFTREDVDVADDSGVLSAAPNGWVQFFVSHAWDVATLIQASVLPSRLLERLRDHDQFQGARYEVAVAAIFARLNCEIEFLDDDALRGVKHPEFIATHRPTGIRVAVEAKSRHRDGVINRAGKVDSDHVVRGDVRRLFNRALEKDTGQTPFLIFIDVNAPPTLNTGFKNQWQTDVKRMMNDTHPPGTTDLHTYGGLAITNFSPHYDGDELAQGSEWTYFRPQNPAFPVEDQLAAMIRHALGVYHRIPDISRAATFASSLDERPGNQGASPAAVNVDAATRLLGCR